MPDGMPWPAWRKRKIDDQVGEAGPETARGKVGAQTVRAASV